jgi:arsenate reductase
MVKIYHNTACSKSNEVCELLLQNSIEAEIIEYLATPPTKEELQQLLNMLGMQPSELVRRGEPIFMELYAGGTMSEPEWLDVLLKYPILIERPIVVNGNRAIIGRPPETVLDLIG